MKLKTPFELLIECEGCGLENLIPEFTPEVPAVCNQCRENMLAYDLQQTHQGHTCDSCGRAYLLKTETEFVDGESECQCGSRDFTELSLKDFADQTAQPQTSESDDADPILTGAVLHRMILPKMTLTKYLMTTRGFSKPYFLNSS